MSLPPNRTPFDDDLVANPNAPRHTQPLPAQQPAQVPVVPPSSSGTQSSTGSPLPPTFTPTTPPTGPSTFAGAPPLPRQVIPADDDVPVQTTTLSARRVPMSVIVGLAMVGGAIGVVMLSSAFGRLAPRPDSVGVITAEQEQAREAGSDAAAPITPAPTAPAPPRVVVIPPRTSKPTAAYETDADSTDSNASNAGSANAGSANLDDASPDDVPTPDIVEPNRQSGRNVRSGSNRNAATAPRSTNNTSNNRTSDNGSINSDTLNNDTADASTPENQDLRSDSNRNLSRDNSDDTGSANIGSANSRDNQNDNSSAANNGATSRRDIEYSNQGVRPRYVERRRSYSIRPPSGFQIAQRGRRTIWQGPGNAQFLVEVGDAEGASPREDWENLERGLRRKYGRRYRSYGIRETTINGRNAAIWEFELQTPTGRVRKVDVAVHDGKNGYAVLGSAPAADFENYRPVFDRAIRSLQIDSNQTNGANNSDRDQNNLSAPGEGY